MNEQMVGQRYLYTDHRLSVSACETANGKKVWLLGNAFCADGEKSAEEDIKSFSGDSLTELSRFWTGRYVLITENELLTDATGLMGAFYSKNGTVSSSLKLLATTQNLKTTSSINASGINWQILPLTLFDGIKKLLSTERIDLSNGFSVKRNNWVTDYRHLTTEEKCEKTAEILKNAVKNISAFSGKKIVLALTGGKDSRVTLSALLNAGVGFSTYTAEHENISSSDRKLPQKLAKAFGKKHEYIKRQKLDQNKLSDYYNFSASNSKGADAAFYACGQFDSFGEDTLILRSGLFEAAQTYARRHTTEQNFFEDMTAHYFVLKNGKQREAFELWADNAMRNPIDYVDIRDRFYIEQRVGGWAAAIEQSFDIADFTSIQIANCKELLSIFLSCNDKERAELSIAYKTMELLEPKVLSFATNKKSLFDKLRLALKATKRRLK